MKMRQWPSRTAILFPHACGGFTLIELITTLAVAAIMLTLAVPAFSTIIKNSRLTTQANDFLTTLTYARSEAITRGSRITVCKSSDSVTCITSGGWDQGWIAFTDYNSDATVDPNDQVLRVHGALSSGTTLNGDINLSNYISYVSQGNSQLTSGAIQSGKMVECDDRGFGSAAQAITVSATGRAQGLSASAAGATSCTP
jgi:type IV fimbrial biogenesis protein FimT